MVIQELKRKNRIKYSRGVWLNGIKFESSLYGEEDLQEDLNLEFMSLNLLHTID